VPVWQSIYDELKDQNFEIILAAQDTGGVAAAGKFYDDAEVTYTAIIDEKHVISSLFNFVNVPSGAWIDEEGKVVRINEGTYAKKYGSFGTDEYVPALRDWIAKGKDSQYVWDEDKVASKIKSRTSEQERADPAFKLGIYFHINENKEKAEQYWTMAQELNPDNINYFRQDLSFTEEGSAGVTFMKKYQEFQSRGKDYYDSLDLEEPEEVKEK